MRVLACVRRVNSILRGSLEDARRLSTQGSSLARFWNCQNGGQRLLPALPCLTWHLISYREEERRQPAPRDPPSVRRARQRDLAWPKGCFLSPVMLLGRLSSRRVACPASSASSWRTVSQLAPRVVRPRHPAFLDQNASLSGLPEFRTRGDDVRVIYEPTEFYTTLLVRLLLAGLLEERWLSCSCACSTGSRTQSIASLLRRCTLARRRRSS